MIEHMNEWLENVCHAKIALTCSKDGRLSTSTFLYSQTADSMAKKIREGAHRFISSVEVKDGWILIELSPAFYEHLIEACRPAPEPELSDRVENRLNIWKRHGGDGCPDDSVVKKVLLRSALGLATEQEILTMTHHLDSNERIELESQLGAVAEAILYLRRKQL